MVLVFCLNAVQALLLPEGHVRTALDLNNVPEIPVCEGWRLLPALLGLWLKETVVNMNRVRQVQPALLVS